MGEVRAVIFDWGGVLIDDPAPGLMQYCADALGVPKEIYVQAHRKFAADFQTGKIGEDVFWAGVCEELEVSQPKEQSLWYPAFKAVYSPKKNMFELAESLQKRGYKTAFLSNTEIPAVRFFLEQGYDMFDVLVFSCIEGIKKPDRRIYELTVERLCLEPAEAVLIDDRAECIDGAKEAGLKTILFASVEQVKDELLRFSVKIA
jgi:epoxide hydrolase-like predicted phosphatase